MNKIFIFFKFFFFVYYFLNYIIYYFNCIFYGIKMLKCDYIKNIQLKLILQMNKIKKLKKIN